MKKATQVDNQIRLTLNGKDYKEGKAQLKALPHFTWDVKLSCFVAPLRPFLIKKLVDFGYTIDLALLSEIPDKTDYDSIIIPEKYNYMFVEEEFAWQKKALQFIAGKKGRGLIVADPGKGKTPFALKYLEWVNTFPALIISPTGVKYNWEEKALEWLDDKSITTNVCEGVESIKKSNTDITIINYDLISAHVEARKVNGRFHYIISEALQELSNSDFKSLIIDETQYIKESTSLAYHGVKYLSTNIETIIGLSGTPIENRAREFFNITNILFPKLFPSRAAFHDRYCDPKKKRFNGRMFFTFDGLTNGEELHQLLSRNVMLRVKGKSRITRHIIPLNIDTAKYKEYISEFKEKTKASKKSSNTLAQFEWLKQKTYELKREQCFLQTDKLLRENGKIVIFAVNKSVVKDLADYYGDRAIKIDGEINSRGKYEAVKEFQKDKDVLIANIRAGATGVDGLQKVCNTMVSVQFPWHEKLMLQEEGRLDRGGQKRLVDHYLLVALETIDEYMIELIDGKGKNVDMVMEGTNNKPNEKSLKKLLKKVTKGT